MFEHKGTDEFDIGAGYGEYEYDFFTINGAEDFWALINHYGSMCSRFNYFLDGYNVIENNGKLSPVVQEKMKEHNANTSLTFLVNDFTENSMGIKKMIVNEQKPDGSFDTFCFYFFHFVEKMTRDYLDCGLAYAKSGLHNAAIMYFSQAIRLAPDISHLYVYRGISYQKKRKLDKAKADFIKAFELNPEDKMANECLDGIE